MAKKKITLKSNNGDELYPLTMVQQVEGLKDALDGKLGKTEKAASAGSLTPLTLDHADTTSNAGLTVYQLWTGDEGTDILPNGSMMLNMATNDGVKKQLLFGHPVGSNNNMVIQYRRRTGSWSDWKTVAFTDSNVASATKADTATDSSKLGGISASNYMKGDGGQKHINFNEQLNVGIFRNTGVSTDPVEGAPTEGGGYGNLMVIRSGGVDTLAQMYFNYHNNSVFVRAGNTDPSSTVFIGSRAWSKVRYMDDLVTTSHIADAAITSSKLASNIILKGIPQLETQSSLSSASQNIASVGLVKEAVDGIEIGGRNLALDSNVVVENNTYVMYKCNTSEDLETDREYTMTIWGTLGSDRDSFRLYDSGVSVALGTFTLVSLNRYVLTFKYRGNYPRLLNILQFHSTSTSSSVIQKVKLERGNKATDYTLAPEEVEEKVATSINDKLEGYASIQYVNNKVANIGTPGNATETGAGIVRAATQAEVAAGHVSDNDPAEMAFVRPETLQSKLSNYPTTTAMTQAINESRQIIYYQSSQPSGGKNGDIWIKP